MEKKALGVLLLAFFVAGCEQPTIQAGSMASFEQSRAEIRESLSADDRKTFDQAMAMLRSRPADMDDEKDKTAETGQDAGNSENVEKGENEKKEDRPAVDELQKFHGKTADEIVAMAEAIAWMRLEDARGELVSLKEDRVTLQEELATLEKIVKNEEFAAEQRLKEARAALEKFRVTSASYEWEKTRFTENLIMKLSAENGLDTPISRAHFFVRIRHPARDRAHVEETFDYDFPGDLKPGESKSWSFRPSRHSGGWRKAPKGDANTEISVVAYKVDGPKGRTLHNAAKALLPQGADRKATSAAAGPTEDPETRQEKKERLTERLREKEEKIKEQEKKLQALRDRIRLFSGFDDPGFFSSLLP